ncbi:hypothetical protein ACC861_38190, partial [Rhizobium ruizarguesonis]
DFADFPADVLLKPKSGHAGRKLGIFLLNSSTQFLEAELLHSEIERAQKQYKVSAVALIQEIAVACKAFDMSGLRSYA